MIQNDSEINKKISSLPEDQRKAIEWLIQHLEIIDAYKACLLYTSPSPRD